MVSLSTANLERRVEFGIRFLHVSTHLLYQPKAGEALGEDFLISGLLGELHCFLSVLFHKRELRLRSLQVMGESQMTQTFPLFVRIACNACHLAHPLKICDGFVECGQQHPHETTTLVHR